LQARFNAAAVQELATVLCGSMREIVRGYLLPKALAANVAMETPEECVATQHERTYDGGVR